MGIWLLPVMVVVRPPIEPLQESDGGELDEVLVSGAVPREQHEMRIRAGCFGRGALTLVAGAGGEGRPAAAGGAGLARPGLGGEMPRPAQVSVVGDRGRGHAPRLGPGEPVADPGCVR